MIISAVALLALLIAGSTMAWFTDKEEATNTFSAGTVDVDINENEFVDIDDWVPGDKEVKNVDIDVTSISDTYVRVKLTPTWTKGDQTLETKFVKIYFTQPSKWVNGDGTSVADGIIDGWIYYKGDTNGIVKKPDKLDLIEYVEFLGSTEDQNAYQGATFTLKIDTEAVQADNDAYKTQWNLSKLPWEAVQ